MKTFIRRHHVFSLTKGIYYENRNFHNLYNKNTFTNLTFLNWRYDKEVFLFIGLFE